DASEGADPWGRSMRPLRSRRDDAILRPFNTKARASGRSGLTNRDCGSPLKFQHERITNCLVSYFLIDAVRCRVQKIGVQDTFGIALIQRHLTELSHA